MSTPSKLIPLLLLFPLISCRFDLRRELSPGELRGEVLVDDAIDGEVRRVGAVDARVAVGNSSLSVRVDARGRVVLRRLGAGSYRVALTWDRDADGIPEALLGLRNVEVRGSPNGPDAVSLGSILLVASGSVDGVVRIDGQPVAGASLQVLDEAGEVDPNLPTAVSDALGRYRLPFVRAGTARVRATFDRTEGAVTTVLTAMSAAITVAPRALVHTDLALAEALPAASGTLSGRLSAFAGVTDASVRLVGASVISQELGNGDLVTLAGVPAGRYTAIFSAPGYVDVEVPDLVVNGDVDLGTILFSQELREGVAQDCDGDGVPGCTGGGGPGCEPDDDDDGVPDAEESPPCVCRPGAIEQPSSSGVVLCRPRDPCERSGVCDPNATCSSVLGQATCACLPGWEGDGRTCTPSSPVTCTTSADCGAGQLCRDEVCVENVCESAADCPAGFDCDLLTGTCFHAAPTLCTSNADCPSGRVCEVGSGACVGCLADTDCGPGLICNPQTSECESDGGAPCATKYDCPAGQICKGSPRLCQAPRFDNACNADLDCAAGFVCSFGKECVSGCADPRDCAAPALCSPVTFACESCSRSNPCPAGNACDGGACQTTVACTSTSECASHRDGFVCLDGFCNNCGGHADCAADPYRAESRVCDSAGKCAAAGCTDESCRQQLGTRGYCSTATAGCAVHECLSSADCAASEGCSGKTRTCEEVVVSCDRPLCDSECVSTGGTCDEVRCDCLGPTDACATDADCPASDTCALGICSERALTGDGAPCDGVTCVVSGCVGAASGLACVTPGTCDSQVSFGTLLCY